MAEPPIPRLAANGSAVQLLVDDKPFLMLAGELHNSSASGAEYMRSFWPHLKTLGLNTVLAPVSWELVEPAEGQFDFALVDAMLDLARQHRQRLVLLWFGSWKNGVSSYAPEWVLRNTQRFPRAKGSSRQNTKDILSTLSDENLRADANAFARLMKHLKDADAEHRTVLMVQVENEVGIKPETRDLSGASNRVYQMPVPKALIEHLQKHKTELHPALRDRWAKSQFAAEGNWSAVFGEGPETDEIFSAWHYARYIDQVAAAGQKEYPLPMYVNAWLESKLGTYPTGGPVSHVHDIWRAAAPHIAVLAPDIYVDTFKETCSAYASRGNPLFVPEASTDAQAAARAYWVIAEHGGLGFSPFGIESLAADHPVVETYRILGQLMPAITAAQRSGQVMGVFRQGNEPSPEPRLLGDYTVEIRYEDRLPKEHPPVGGLVIHTGDEDFLIAGYGFSCRFRGKNEAGKPPRSTGISRVELGHFNERGDWIAELRLNGDETGANYVAKIPPFLRNERLGTRRPMILRVKTYRYE